MRIVDLPVYKGRGFRVDTGFKQERGTTAGDVVRFEQDELGNDLGADAELLEELDRYPALDLVWVVPSRETALRYGEEVAQVNLGLDPRIVAEDGDEGYLVIRRKKGNEGYY